MILSRFFTAVAACALMLSLVGCSKDEKSKGPTRSEYQAQRQAALEKIKSGKLTKKPKAEVAKAKPGEAEVAAGEQQGQKLDASFEYQVTKRRDPFRSFILAAKTSRQVETPLETFDLFQLELVAVIWGDDQRRALVLDPSGRPYIVQEGTPIGKNLGKVVSIGDNVVWVEETYIDPLGNRTLKTIEMRLYPQQEG